MYRPQTSRLRTRWTSWESYIYNYRWKSPERHGSRQQPHRLRPECTHLALLVDGPVIQVHNRVPRSQKLPGRNHSVIVILAAANLVLIQPCLLLLTHITICAACPQWSIGSIGSIGVHPAASTLIERVWQPADPQNVFRPLRLLRRHQVSPLLLVRAHHWSCLVSFGSVPFGLPLAH